MAVFTFTYQFKSMVDMTKKILFPEYNIIMHHNVKLFICKIYITMAINIARNKQDLSSRAFTLFTLQSIILIQLRGDETFTKALQHTVY